MIELTGTNYTFVPANPQKFVRRGKSKVLREKAEPNYSYTPHHPRTKQDWYYDN
jgi:hypothetical protein